MKQNRKIVLEEQDISDLENLINNLPVFAKNVFENHQVSRAVVSLMEWIGSKIVKEIEEKKE